MRGLALAILISCAVGAPRQSWALCVTDAVGCDDGNACTRDGCVGLECQHEPLTGPACDDGDRCTSDDRCREGRCVGDPVICPDDGFSCTADVCVAGGCVHVPADSRCVPVDACGTAMCSPGAANADGGGCVLGELRSDGEECAEDGDACTVDRCDGGRCSHSRAGDPTVCGAVQDAFWQALWLEAVARGMAPSLAPASSLALRVEDIGDALGATARVLAGKTPPAGGRRAALGGTALQRRAGSALAILQGTRPDVGALVYGIARRPGRTALGPLAADLGRRGRTLRRGIRSLRAELRRLARQRAVFAR